ncbi:unnamed protein product [Rotaria socialis]|uniref:Chromatin modification-related protein MEAF6 n=1 Tax=Rotaria socialis TaxID=392032 RepID=A0A820I3D9_9BILA|nr:unnamed protein product [Rotaria socialis]
MKDSSVAATSPAPASPTTNKEKPTINHVFRDTRSELAQLLKKKEEIEKSLSDIEEQIYAFETSYLKQTQDTGNCIRGWSSCLTNGNGNNNSNDKSAKFRESDRLFSYSSATSYTLLGRDRLKREREKERRKNIRKHREIMQELSTNKKNTSIVSENNTQLTQPINDEGDEDIVDEDESTTSSEKPPSRSMTNTSTSSDEDIVDEDESTTSSEKPPSRSMTNTSTSSKRRTKSKSLRNKRALSDSSQHSES